MTIFKFFVTITAILHILFFKLESIDFMKDHVLKRFALTKEQGQVIKIWALNQGFYNLFLALGLFYSLYLGNGMGIFLARYILFVILGAAFVLFASAPKKYIPALIQGLPALAGIIASFFG
ncbi:DUF1304 domain-containing protein [Bacteriovorax sp. Seq25_V]|uniref:DUF1304 domain-containing protein n=1 Tax=Bacteriovorax sp. Seq25_V TaxID=1201288 RepID=UPI00038A3785|nr:DUF1304 domain-containing protein [Bacteriovorax sp. Seq25_V]EQC43851.1 PF06993 family protein [Bacteriovorax sp. Seq25_V]